MTTCTDTEIINHHGVPDQYDDIIESFRHADTDCQSAVTSRPWREFQQYTANARYWLNRIGNRENSLRRALLCLNGGLNHVDIGGAYHEGSPEQQQAYTMAKQTRQAILDLRNNTE